MRRHPGAHKPGQVRHADTLRKMKKALTAELERIPDRPFGEFVPSGSAMPAGDYDEVFATLRKAAGQKKKTRKKR